MKRRDWEPQEISTLRQFWIRQDIRAKMIAFDLNRTKNSVISKAHRIGLGKKATLNSPQG